MRAGQRRHTESGFTLLELLVVMVIIGLLAGFVAPRYFAQVGKSQVKAARAQIDALDKALEQYRIDVGHLPTTEQGLAALNAQPPGEQNWAGPYLKKDVPLDPWGSAYLYAEPGTHNNDYDLISLGKDGRVGGTGEAADLGNW
jgi:general secretion pathway protein G